MRGRPTTAMTKVPYPLAAAAALLLAAAAPAQDEAAFDQGYAAVRALLQKSRWSEAKNAIDQLLAQHQGKDYAIGQRRVVVEDYRLCCFYLETPVPRPDELVSGKIESYSASRGSIRVRYDQQSMQDWQKLPNGLLLHPAMFRGNFTVTASGSGFPLGSCSIVFAADDEGLTSAEFGGDGSLAFVHRGEGGAEVLDQKRVTGVKRDKKYQVAVRVSRTGAEVLCDRRPVLKLRREHADVSNVALFGNGFEDVVLDGEIEPSWLQGLVDERLSQQREAFDRKFEPGQRLPQWLFVDPPVQRVAPKFANAWPSAEEPARQVTVIHEYIQHGELQRASAAAEKLPDDEAPTGIADYMRGLTRLRLGQPEAAQRHCQRVLARWPQWTFAQLLQADVLRELRQPAVALQLLQQAAAADPGEVEVYRDLVPLLLQLERPDEAERVLRDARTRCGLGQEIADLDLLLAMARRGPGWHRRYTWHSPHYEITTDIDARVCYQASRILEQAYVNLKSHLSWVKDAGSDAPFRVFLFSGEAGYQDYCKQILGSEVPHTAGLYSPVLKQLLIWNVPKREDMERTIRHEGFHQFLDRVMFDPPAWFNEGLAEFYETGRYENGRFEGGQHRADHLATLQRSRKLVPKLTDFLHGGRADFYGNAELRYAEGWALVHFLRKGDSQNQKLFARLWEQFCGNASRREAVDAAFAGVDLEVFNGAFWQYIDKLARDK